MNARTLIPAAFLPVASRPAILGRNPAPPPIYPVPGGFSEGKGTGMRTKERVKTKPCPQCGYSAEGVVVEDPADTLKRVPPPPKFDYDCGNCGFRWIE